MSRKKRLSFQQLRAIARDNDTIDVHNGIVELTASNGERHSFRDTGDGLYAQLGRTDRIEYDDEHRALDFSHQEARFA